MKPGQVLTKWWQDLVAGRLRTPQSIFRAGASEKPYAAENRFFTPEESVNWDAPARLRAPGFLLTDGFLKQMDRADWQFVDRRLMRWAALFVELARKRDIPLYIHSAFRTEAEQAELFARGVSKTRYPRSAHNIGEAVDIVHGVYHWTLTKDEWRLLGVLGRLALDRINAQLPKVQKLDLVWGGPDGPGDKFGWDPAHWEIADYCDRVRRLSVSTPVRYTPRRILKEVKL